MGDKCYMNTDHLYTNTASNEINELWQFSVKFQKTLHTHARLHFHFFLLFNNIYTDYFVFSIPSSAVTL